MNDFIFAAFNDELEKIGKVRGASPPDLVLANPNFPMAEKKKRYKDYIRRKSEEKPSSWLATAGSGAAVGGGLGGLYGLSSALGRSANGRSAALFTAIGLGAGAAFGAAMGAAVRQSDVSAIRSARKQQANKQLLRDEFQDQVSAADILLGGGFAHDSAARRHRETLSALEGLKHEKKSSVFHGEFEKIALSPALKRRAQEAATKRMKVIANASRREKPHPGSGRSNELTGAFWRRWRQRGTFGGSGPGWGDAWGAPTGARAAKKTEQGLGIKHRPEAPPSPTPKPKPPSPTPKPKSSGTFRRSEPKPDVEARGWSTAEKAMLGGGVATAAAVPAVGTAAYLASRRRKKNRRR
jgi:hypothetical protein